MNKILVETSARHVHVSREDLDILFGKGFELTVKKELSQPGQYASNERVTVVGPKREIANISILGPVRKQTQVELSATDARSVGIPIAVRESGDLAGTPGCKIVGPCGEVGPEGEIEISEGVIVAKRHIHLTPETAAEYGVEDKQIVSVEINGEGRKTVFGDVVIRVSDKFAPAMHIDTDESNACLSNGEGYIVK